LCELRKKNMYKQERGGKKNVQKNEDKSWIVKKRENNKKLDFLLILIMKRTCERK